MATPFGNNLGLAAMALKILLEKLKLFLIIFYETEILLKHMLILYITVI